ncbi:AMP-binding protein [Bradyrhizobium sp. U87765 SZCCT0131]|uniref:FadD3 family acyl-CoA ligase n=1 Tax=unclassified Bradyrhizobium TaxID=2631580 RepID=UPI001BADA300|nr:MULTISPECIES: FadD3 family acyl-CoA ligase [unclassified Bradyrhizobium]MBR1218025.1 AMP-binding protein [Bradyrhizobium sp. U87765 SZCCT0131]MBR1261029.1 AMP-binding protein [Bradyrhizobium sp. U87765 SZCCT0134]MBR1303523.1 AMP-binding protein [Bradyrhizobium sp. U87765 SZCCT0110]MBR1319129.1 AMP-binding protein [Bradyrhizobium sp. U87765 SZCCT0109]MBR1347454.1 AMP-binding protein [Bradyrhizobium sp. U87765 SZCCT0048]
MTIEQADWEFTTIPALCARAAELYGTQTAIEDGIKLNFIELDAARRRAAKALIAAGVQKGDRIMIWAPNSWKWFVAALGLVSVGAILIPTSTRFKGTEVAELARRSGTSMMFSVGDFLGQYYPDQLAPETRGLLRQVVVFDGAREGDVDWDTFLATGDGISASDLEQRVAAVGPDDLCDMLFTSGTTGYPKGVMYGHRQCLRAIDAWATRVGIRAHDRVLVIAPFFHAFGYRSGAIVSLMRGAVLMPHLTYDAGEILKRISDEKISVIPGPPAIFHGMLQHPELAKFDTSSLRLGITGGAVVPSILIRRMREELGFAGVVNGYGLTECGGYGTMCRADDPDDVIANTAGKASPGVDVRIMGPDGKFLADGERGEVVIRGYIVMKGYFEDPESTAKTIDKDGWLHTGDIGYFDEDANLRIEDRLKDMYITGGFNCYPAEIERLLSTHPAIGTVAVIGVSDERLGEVGKAFVVLRPGTAATEKELLDWSRAHMANYKCPRSVEIRESLPTSPQGKVLKNMLRNPVPAAS